MSHVFILMKTIGCIVYYWETITGGIPALLAASPSAKID
jgi:hypothetical protein